jgi:hypothetical protein
MNIEVKSNYYNNYLISFREGNTIIESYISGIDAINFREELLEAAFNMMDTRDIVEFLEKYGMLNDILDYTKE